jgi:hypothetical protein
LPGRVNKAVFLVILGIAELLSDACQTLSLGTVEIENGTTLTWISDG